MTSQSGRGPQARQHGTVRPTAELRAQYVIAFAPWLMPRCILAAHVGEGV